VVIEAACVKLSRLVKNWLSWPIHPFFVSAFFVLALFGSVKNQFGAMDGKYLLHAVRINDVADQREDPAAVAKPDEFGSKERFYTAPIAAEGKVLVANGAGDGGTRGWVAALDVKDGKELWRFYTVPQNAGDKGADTWPSLQAARYGGGHPWLPGVYDPETNLYIFGTGNPIPAYTLGRGEGDNLFTCSLIAVDVATGTMKWYFQTSPHDMHDWDSAQTPVLFDAMVGGKKRKLVSTAARNGYFFTLDRTTGEKVVVTKYGSATNWAASVDAKGSVRREPTKDPLVAGALTSPTSGGTINWEPPAYSPVTGLFYVSERNGHSIYYLTDPDPRGSMGLAGKEEVFVGNTGNFLTAIDPLTGKVAWRRPYPAAGGTGMYGGGGAGLLTTAGKLVSDLGMTLHAGHGLNYHNVVPVACIPKMHELNIGHAIISRAVLIGLERAVREMNRAFAKSRGRDGESERDLL
jgi:outer membrane protein assembly factor BamB